MLIKEFQKRIHEWIQNERSFLEEWKSGIIPRNRIGVSNLDSILERIEFNILDAFYDYVYPEQCPECTRTGKDHKYDCSHFDDKDSRARNKFVIDKRALDL